MNILLLVFVNIFRWPMRSILLITSITIAFLLFGVLGALNNTLSAGTGSAARDRLVTINRISFTVAIPYSYLQQVENIDGVRNAAPVMWLPSYYQHQRNSIQVFAVLPGAYLEAYPEIVLNENSRSEFVANRTCAVVGRGLANQYGWVIGERIPIRSLIWQRRDELNSWEVDVCGIFDDATGTLPTSYMLMNYEYLNDTLAVGRDTFHWLIVNTVNPEMNGQISIEIDSLFENSAAQTSTTSEAAFNESFMNQYGDISTILILVNGASFSAIIMIVGMTMVTSVNKRTKEIAILKAVGFTEIHIAYIILMEALILSYVGGFIGIIIATLLVSLISSAMDGLLPTLTVSIMTTIYASALMTGLGLVTGTLPAFNAMKMPIATAFEKT